MAAVREGGDISYRDFIEDLNSISHEPSEIQKFYEDATIFVTGGTGFMGKVLIEKLLRSCPKLKRIYLLIRAKKGKDINERFQEQFDDALFEPLKTARPDFRDQITPISGDCALDDLGLSPADREKLAKEVDIFFHGAATVRFDESLRTAVAINLKGTKFALDLARQMRNLKAFVHISTAYANCPHKEIHEKFYAPPITYSKITNLVELLDDKNLEILTPSLIQSWPNTYTFTKMIAEDVIREFGQGLPIGICRPSIVVSTAKEPISGWINNFYGPQGVVFGSAIGLMRTLHCDPNVVADLVPVDYVINMIIAMAWDLGVTKGDNPNFENIQHANERTNGNSDDENQDDSCDIPIVNYVSSEKNPINWQQFMHYNRCHADDIPSTHQLWLFNLSLTRNYHLNFFYQVVFHLFPAIILDSVAYLMGKQPMFWKAYQKIHKFSDVISHFCTKQWKFHDNNVQILWEKVKDKDRQIFDFNIADLEWESYFFTYIRGLRTYMAKEPMSTVPAGKKKLVKIKIAYYSLAAVSYFICFYLIWKCLLVKLLIWR